MAATGPKRKDFKLIHQRVIMRNLERELKRIEGKGMKGMIEAAIHVRRSMDKVPPKIPIDQGNLRASWFIVTSRGGGNQYKGRKPKGKVGQEHPGVVSAAESSIVGRMPVVAMGFSANYAIYVHENLNANFAGKQTGKKKDSRRPGAGPRFFSAALDRNRKEIIRIIAEHAKIK